ncbi:hypothetical protein GCM10009676_10290 [Prauserella halophila]|uniref:Uncharacterized protein n=1 Tax=Prauserella halophila TaxID=185641 RepID=A0ABN1W2G8_9PSEU|nr:hypothetical protein [Prauserella halophila]
MRSGACGHGPGDARRIDTDAIADRVAEHPHIRTDPHPGDGHPLAELPPDPWQDGADVRERSARRRAAQALDDTLAVGCHHRPCQGCNRILTFLCRRDELPHVPLCPACRRSVAAEDPDTPDRQAGPADARTHPGGEMPPGADTAPPAATDHPHGQHTPTPPPVPGTEG